MLKLVKIALCCAVLSMPVLANAKTKLEVPDWLGLETTYSLGGPVFIGTAKIHRPYTTVLFMARFGQAVRLPKCLPIVIQADLMLPGQFNLSLGVDVFKLGPARLSANIGLMWAFDEPISVTRVKRDWDLTVGAEASWLIVRHWRVALEYRVFIPDPSRTEAYYGTFFEPILEEALKGGQLWLGASYVW